MSDKTLMGYIAEMPSTNVTIALGLVLAVLYVLVALTASLFRHEIGEHTLDTVGIFIASMMGIGGLQFAAKRITDTGLATAKAGAAPAVVVPSNTTTVIQPTAPTDQPPPASGNAG